MPPTEKVRLSLAYKPILEERARANLVTHTIEGYQGLQNSAKAVKPIDTRAEIAKMSGVSHDTVAKVEKVLNEAPKPIVEAARKGEMSVNAAYTFTKMDEEKQTEVGRQNSAQPVKTRAELAKIAGVGIQADTRSAGESESSDVLR